MIILMFYNDHLPPHFHVRYGEHAALIHISPAQLGEGALPRRIAVGCWNGRSSGRRNCWQTGIALKRASRSNGSTRRRIPMKLVDVTALAFLDGYRVRLTFSDDVEQELDLEPYLNGPIFEPVRDLTYFCQAFIADGAITWPNGADIDTQVLRYGLTPAAWE
jgi:Protein of unknown function (DUF2442)/Domain of unknown function (DUF4160)